MSDIFPTKSMSKDEIIYHYERISKDCLKLAEENAQLKKSNKYYSEEIDRLEKRIQQLKKK